MKPAWYFLAAGLLPAVVTRGSPADAAILASMRLSEQLNYSWISTVVDDARTYDISGQTERGGFTRVKMPIVNAVLRRLGRSVTDTQVEAIFRGDAHCVLLTDDHWKTIDELPWAPEEEPEVDPLSASIGSLNTGIGGLNSVPGMGASTRRRAPERAEPDAYSNLQLAISRPHEDLGVIVSSHVEWNVDGDIVTGTLNELGAQLLLVHDGQNEITPLRATGSFKLWLRDGMVAKYQLTLEGILAVSTHLGRKRVAVRQTSTTELKNVGTTKFEVPEEARRKLGA
jgi:hypothetical protein